MNRPLETTAQPVQVRRLADQVIVQLKRWLEESRQAVGTRLPTEPQLMAHFGVGRSTVREAVRALVHVGVLEVRHGDGTYFRALPSNTESFDERLKRAHIAEVFEVRRAFEMGVARLAAHNRTAEDVRRIRKALEDCRKSIEKGEGAQFLKADYAFHTAIAAATKNQLLTDLYNVFRKALTGAMADELVASKEALQTVVALHDRLYAAIAAKDGEGAQAVWFESENPFSPRGRGVAAVTKQAKRRPNPKG